MKKKIRFGIILLLFLGVCASASSLPNISVATDGIPQERSKQFRVLDHETEIHEAYEKADQKFVDAAASFSPVVRNGKLEVTVYCPVPEGVKYAPSNYNPCLGDVVELFIKPMETGSVYYQYIVNADGRSCAFRYFDIKMPDTSWKSMSKMTVSKNSKGFTVKIIVDQKEIREADWSSGGVLWGNVLRHGPTAGGVSCWSPVSIKDFHTPAKFGRFIVGSRKSYFKRTINRLKAAAGNKLSANLQRREKALLTRINKDGDKRDAFSSIETAVNAFNQGLIAHAAKNMKVVFYEADVWKNNFQPKNVITPLKKITITAPMNGKAVYPLAFANLTDKRYMGQFKYLRRESLEELCEFSRLPYNDKLSRHIKVSEAVPIQTLNSEEIFDVLVPLPLNTLIRCEPYRAIPLFIEVDTHGLAPGKYTGLFYSKPSYMAFDKAETIEFELNVMDVDLSKVKVDSFIYTYHDNKDVESGLGRAKFMVDQEVNILYIRPNSITPIMPQITSAGKIVHLDFGPLDARIDLMVKAGMPLERIKLFIETDPRHFYFFVDGRRKVIVGKYRDGRWDDKWFAVFKEWLMRLTAHLKEKYGMDESRYWFYPIDEPGGDPENPASGAYLAVRMSKFIKSVNPKYMMFANPYNWRNNEQARKTLLGMAPHFDLFLPGRNYINNKETLSYLRQCKGQIGTYVVYNNMDIPAVYRSLNWRNLRDGFIPMSPFWCLDNFGGGDGFDPRDFERYGKNRYEYGTTYVDFGSRMVLTSRRQVAWYQGFQDRKIVELCRMYMAKLAAKGVDIKPFEKEISRLAELGARSSMSGMEACKQKLMHLAVKLKDLNSRKK